MNGSSGPQIRTDSPMIKDISSPNRSCLSSTKSWCSSPFSNLGALSPDNHSLTFSLADLSPTLTFSSPRNRFSTELSSPQSSSLRFPKDYSSIFSPSLFSPFNKSLAPGKFDKLLVDTDDIDHDQSRFSEIEETPDIFQRTQSILPQLLKAAECQSDGSLRNNLNSGGFDLEESESPVPNKLLSSKYTRSRSLMTDTSSPCSPQTNQNTTTLLPKQNSNNRKIQSTPSPKSNFSSPPIIAKAKQTNMSPNMEPKGTCNCKKSRCLKLYCDCFAALRYCSGCNCVDCNNCQEYETVRSEAIQLTRDRNPSAFQMKVSVKRGHVAGCHCKKSRCLKKYCECFEGSVFCGPNCKCVECQNLAGSEALKQAKLNMREKRDRPLKAESPSEIVEIESKSIGSPKLCMETALQGVSATPYKIRTKSFIQGDTAKFDAALREITSSGVSSNSRSTQSISPSSESNSLGGSDVSNSSRPLKKRKVDNPLLEKREPLYPFFGPNLPPTTKLIALSCLEYLDGPSLYSLSCVNRLWSQAAMDDALWE